MYTVKRLNRQEWAVMRDGEIVEGLNAIGGYKEIYPTCEVAHKQANYLNCRRGSKMQKLNTSQSGMFNETSEDLPLFSGQDYGPADKGKFVARESWIQMGLPEGSFNEDYADTVTDPSYDPTFEEVEAMQITRDQHPDDTAFDDDPEPLTHAEANHIAAQQSDARIRKGVRVTVMVDGFLKYRGTCISANPNRAYAGAPDEYDIELDDDNFGYVYAKFADFPNGLDVLEETQGQI